MNENDCNQKGNTKDTGQEKDMEEDKGRMKKELKKDEGYLQYRKENYGSQHGNIKYIEQEKEMGKYEAHLIHW